MNIINHAISGIIDKISNTDQNSPKSRKRHGGIKLETYPTRKLKINH